MHLFERQREIEIVFFCWSILQKLTTAGEIKAANSGRMFYVGWRNWLLEPSPLSIRVWIYRKLQRETKAIPIACSLPKHLQLLGLCCPQTQTLRTKSRSLTREAGARTTEPSSLVWIRLASRMQAKYTNAGARILTPRLNSCFSAELTNLAYMCILVS